MRRFCAFLLVLLTLCCCAASAHPGRTDSQGGHTDHSTGKYHFHHGHPAHQHPDGVCPYATPTPKPKPAPTRKPTSTPKPTPIPTVKATLKPSPSVTHEAQADFLTEHPSLLFLLTLFGIIGAIIYIGRCVYICACQSAKAIARATHSDTPDESIRLVILIVVIVCGIAITAAVWQLIGGDLLCILPSK